MIVPALTTSPRERFRLTHLLEGPTGSTLAADVIRGFAAVPRWLSPKYFYDAHGAELFDAICDTPEYYPTRTEQALLDQVADEIIAEASPTTLVELGSGAARKTRTLLEALGRAVDEPTYVPVDIAEEMLTSSAMELLDDYPALRIHGVIADYDHHLHLLPRGGRRLIAFLGSTIGNFRQPGAVRFLRAIATGMDDDDSLLLGVDLVKSPAVLHAAYNDAAGLTAEFNCNVLRVINRELGADFAPQRFAHDARYVPEQRQIEMYLVSREAQIVDIPGVARRYRFAEGERIRTEISRKQTRASTVALLAAAGLDLRHWHESPDGYFALALAGR
jgi:L-histidine N-alpha-methyltransferase